tara:strand:+ start:5368 stop:6000 length:633 start_codon:yes stop_codon:yes gene_type:complete
MKNLKVVVLISGKGSNFKAILNKCNKKNVPAKVVAVISNNPRASGLKINGNFEKIVIDNNLNKKKFESQLHAHLKRLRPNLICLAGFMKILNPFIIRKWKNKIINVHPSLLPSFKGLNTHKRVLENGIKITGCTIHFVDESLDGGPIIAQAATLVKKNMSIEDLSKKVLKIEHQIYPSIVHLFAKKEIGIKNKKVFIKNEIKRNFFIKNL